MTTDGLSVCPIFELHRRPTWSAEKMQSRFDCDIFLHSSEDRRDALRVTRNNSQVGRIE